MERGLYIIANSLDGSRWFAGPFRRRPHRTELKGPAPGTSRAQLMNGPEQTGRHPSVAGGHDEHARRTSHGSPEANRQSVAAWTRPVTYLDRKSVFLLLSCGAWCFCNLCFRIKLRQQMGEEIEMSWASVTSLTLVTAIHPPAAAGSDGWR